MEINQEENTSDHRPNNDPSSVLTEVKREEISHEEVGEDRDGLIDDDDLEITSSEEEDDEETELENESDTEEKESEEKCDSIRKNDNKIDIVPLASQGKSKDTSTTVKCQKCLRHFKTVAFLNRHKCPICPICGKMYPNNNDIARHIRLHSKISDKKFVCKICARRFKVKTTLGIHGRVHHNYPRDVGGATCENCEEKFKSLRARDEHVQAFHKKAARRPRKNKRLECTICKKTFTLSQNFTRHVRMFHSESGGELINGVKKEPYHNYLCEMCGKICFDKTALELHIRIRHTKEKPHSCQFCQKNFYDASKLKSHVLNRHSLNEEKPHCCQFCNKRFSLNGNLKTHLKIHSGERPHCCQICGKSFIHKQNLTKHMKVHTGERFEPAKKKESVHAKCDLCDKVFTQRQNLARHIRTIHQGEKLHLCQYCGKSFAQKGNLVNHVRLHTGEKPHGCQFCDQRFPDRGGLKSHVKFHHPGKKS